FAGKRSEDCVSSCSRGSDASRRGLHEAGLCGSYRHRRGRGRLNGASRERARPREKVECLAFSYQSDSVMNELFEGYPFLRVLSKCTHLDYSSLLVPQGPLSSSPGHFDSIHRCHSILYQTCKCSRPTSRTVMPLPSTGVPETGGITGTPRTRIVG